MFVLRIPLIMLQYPPLSVRTFPAPSLRELARLQASLRECGPDLMISPSQRKLTAPSPRGRGEWRDVADTSERCPYIPGPTSTVGDDPGPPADQVIPSPRSVRLYHGRYRNAVGGNIFPPYECEDFLSTSFPGKKLKKSCFFRKSPFTFGDTYGIIKRLAMCRTISLCPLLSCGRKLYEQYTTRPYLAPG